jgi:hypothetical protein
MEKGLAQNEKFEPEMFCLRCQRMEWDEDARACANFQGPSCPLAIRSLLQGLELSCMVV